MNWLHKGLACLVISTLLFGAHFRAYLDAKVRFLKHWEASDAWSLLCAVIILACGFFAVGIGLYRAGKIGRHILVISFLMLFAQGMLVSLRPPANSTGSWGPFFAGLAWCGLAVIFVLMWRRPELGLHAGASKFALVLSPLPFFLAGQLLSFPTHREQHSNSNSTREATTGGPVIIIVFDEWSFDHTFTNSQALTQLPNLSKLLEGATLYSKARSGGDETYISMPRMILQTNAIYKASGTDLKGPASKSIFERIPADYKAMIGFYLPYCTLLSNTVDLCRSYPVSPKGQNFLQKTALHFWDILIYWQDPWVESLRAHWYLPEADKPNFLLGPYWWELTKTITDESLAVIETMPSSALAFFHFPVPHGPFVFGPRGSYREPDGKHADDPAHYLQNLRKMDEIIGLIVSGLKKRQLFDDTILVLTSDHTWRADLIRQGKAPRYAEKARHVPLVIKWREQGEGKANGEPFDLTALAERITRGF